MNNTFFNFIIRQFAGKISMAIWTLILAVVTGAVGWVARQYPPIASVCDPGSIAATLFLLCIVALHWLANDPTVAKNDPELSAVAKAIADAADKQSKSQAAIASAGEAVKAATEPVIVRPAGPPKDEGKG
jgi:hypothetical protein